MISFNEKSQLRIGPPTGIGIKAGSNNQFTFLSYTAGGVNTQDSNGGPIGGGTPSGNLDNYWSFGKVGEPVIDSALVFHYTDEVDDISLSSDGYASLGLTGPIPGFIGDGWYSVNVTTNDSSSYIGSLLLPSLNWDSTSEGVTIWAWVKGMNEPFGSTGIIQFLDVSEGTGFRISINKNADSIIFDSIDGGAGSSASTPYLGSGIDTDYILVCGTYDRVTGLSRIYINGSLAAVAGVSQAVPSFANGFIRVGTDAFAVATPGNMFIDEIGISRHKCYSDSQITSLYNAGAGMTWPSVNTI